MAVSQIPADSHQNILNFVFGLSPRYPYPIYVCNTVSCILYRKMFTLLSFAILCVQLIIYHIKHYLFVVRKGVGIVVRLDCPTKSEMLRLVVVDP